MATVPNCDQATIEASKIFGYLLSATHPIGSAKGRFFRQFGFRESTPDDLVRALLMHVRTNVVADTERTAYGVKHRVDGPLLSPDGRDPRVSTVWMTLDGDPIPRFVTAFPC